MRHMNIQLSKSHIGDTGALSMGLGGETIKISLVYDKSLDDGLQAIHFGTIEIREQDYENFLKALNKARKYVHNPKRKDVVAVPFIWEK